MESSNPSTSASSRMGETFKALQELDPRLRFAVGLFACAVIAYYVPLILVALTGVWINNLTMMDQFVVGVIILVVQNLIGNRLSKILVASIIVAGVFDCYEAFSLIHAPSWSAWRTNWMVFFFPTAACILNAWLFLRFKGAADLQ